MTRVAKAFLIGFVAAKAKYIGDGLGDGKAGTTWMLWIADIGSSGGLPPGYRLMLSDQTVPRRQNALEQTVLRLKNTFEDGPSETVISRMYQNINKQRQQMKNEESEPFWKKWMPRRPAL